MTIRSKRNLPLVLALAGMLTVLVLVIGNQPIVSYTVHTQAVQAASFTGISSNASSLAGLLSLIQP